MIQFISKHRLPIIQVITIIVMILLLGIFVAPIFKGYMFLAVGIIIVIGMGMIYGVIARYFRTPDEKRKIYRNKYHDVFFKGTVIFAILLAVLGIMYGFISYVEGGNPYRIVGLLMTVIWVAVFMIYFVWSVYFYNINYGLTDEEWEKIAKAKEMSVYGVEQVDSEIAEPLYNPYRSQTFGLPPGTVRGMIAFTLLIGGMSLLISSYGMDYITNAEMALRAKQFEFFETAFLMMIAFYFGDRSLKYLRDRWAISSDKSKEPPSAPTDSSPSTSPQTSSTAHFDFPVSDPVGMDDQAFREEDLIFKEINQPESASKPLTGLKKALLKGPEMMESMGSAYVQIRDNTTQKVLADEEIKEALEKLWNEKEIKLSFPVIKAVVAVESSGRGHLPDGKAKILFEGHKFWYWLSKVGKTQAELEELQKQYPDIVYPSWSREHYLLGAEEYKRLEKAKEICKGINDKAAVYSASWGLFQILGENLDHYIKGRNYKDWKDFEQKQHEAESYHFLDFLAFIQTKKLNGKPLVSFISEENNGNYDWASFAYGYNGRGYKMNNYDKKLAAAYHRFKSQGI
ncbi:sodium:proton antiporter [Echinicola strongylocentroti]|uniref:Sodium:proton antiporter n=1 Tax=Echinicola strongylocentroti TaxID=1795355 RepID=A0A2Z4IN98_9BACT|nr:N-acetylmuramidase family protein [Echinicola strongylocentroti]AWW32118.1 sodium:proton antiporter [Echinicola strongylocentroti]